MLTLENKYNEFFLKIKTSLNDYLSSEVKKSSHIHTQTHTHLKGWQSTFKILLVLVNVLTAFQSMVTFDLLEGYWGYKYK